jgi:hypothetical protein
VVRLSGDTGVSRSGSSFRGVFARVAIGHRDPALDRNLTRTLGLHHATAQAHLTREERLTLS